MQKIPKRWCPRSASPKCAAGYHLSQPALYPSIWVVTARRGTARARFDRLYKARREVGQSLQTGRGVWISLYGREVPDPVYYVGAGAGLANPPLLKRKLFGVKSKKSELMAAEIEPKAPTSNAVSLTIAEVKRRLAATFGVREDDISITING